MQINILGRGRRKQVFIYGEDKGKGNTKGGGMLDRQSFAHKKNQHGGTQNGPEPGVANKKRGED